MLWDVTVVQWWKFFRSKSSRDEQNLIFVKNSSRQRLLTMAKHWKGALLMVHSARTSTVPVRLSRGRIFVQLFSLQRVKNKLPCTSWYDAPFRASRRFPFLPCPACCRSFLCAQGRALCLLHRHCMDGSAQWQPALSAVQLSNSFMPLKTNL